MRIKKLYSIINLRNNFIHANLTADTKQALIYDKNVKDSDEPFPKNISKYSYSNIDELRNAIDSFITFLLESMKPKIKYEFQQILYCEEIQATYEDGQLIIEASM